MLTGLSFFLRPHLIAYVWAILWGFATAMSRLYFLSAAGAPYSQALLYPTAEMLVRVVNFTVPLICLVLDQRRPLNDWPRVADRISKIPTARVASIAVVLLLSSRLMAAVAEFNQPHFYYELMKRGESPAAFYAMAGLSALAIFGFFVRQLSNRASSSTLLQAFIVYVSVWPELYEVGLFFHSRGALLSGINLVEHLPVWATAIYWASASIPKFNKRDLQFQPNERCVPQLNLVRPNHGSQHERLQDCRPGGADDSLVLGRSVRL